MLPTHRHLHWEMTKGLLHYIRRAPRSNSVLPRLSRLNGHERWDDTKGGFDSFSESPGSTEAVEAMRVVMWRCLDRLAYVYSSHMVSAVLVAFMVITLSVVHPCATDITTNNDGVHIGINRVYNVISMRVIVYTRP